MRTNFTIKFLLCFLMPAMVIAQSKQKPYVIHESKNKYPGGVYAVWDSVAKKYNWYSPQNNIPDNSFRPTTADKNVEETKETNTTQIFHLVKDINKATDGGGGNYQPQFYNQHYAVLNGVAYFSAEDGVHGTELWRSDGTEAGSYIVKDIESGEGSSGITNITAANGKIYFSATTSANGAQPWISDGTDAGTHILKDITLFANYGYPEMYTAVKEKVFFFIGRNQLWVTDGTDTGTLQVASVGNWNQFSQPVAVDTLLFFTALDYLNGRQLYRSDGTFAGTFLVKQIGYDYNYGPQQLTTYNKNLYFSADDGTGRRLWISDGTYDGTTVIENNNNVLLPSYDGASSDVPLVKHNKTFYFTGYDAFGNTGIELFKYSPDSTEGIVLVKDITPGYENTNIQPHEIASYENGVAFKVINTDGSATLWKTKGSEADTKPIKIFPTVNGFNFYNLYNAAGTLFFEAYSATNGFELWKSNGTQATTVMVKDIFPGIYSSYPYFYTAFSTGILFSARTEAAGYELWKSDGTSAGTRIAKDINQTNTGSSIATTHTLTNTANGVVFAAFNVLHGVEPFYSDGTEANTKLVADIFHGDFSSFPYAMKTVNDEVYFITNYDDNYIPALYKYNSLSKTLVKLFEVPAGYYIQNVYAVADNGLVFFQLFNPNLYQYELWRTDGTSAGSFFLKANQAPSELVTIGNTLFFTNVDYYYGNELFKSDGTVKGTRIINDLFAGAGGSNPYSLIAYNGELYFGAMDEDYATYFWKSDGTFFGTKKVAPIAPASQQYSDVDFKRVYCISNGLLYINALNNSIGEELFITDGTRAGTKLVKDINPNYSSYINNLTDVNGIVCFSADDGTHGNELWATNGKPAGTVLLKDITPGSDASNIYNFCAVDNKLYFLKDGALWMSSGPGNKTMQVNDAGLQNISNINELIASGNKLFFSGYSYMYGQELYEGDISSQPVAENETQNKAIAKEIYTTLRATVSPNPVHNMATVQLSNAKNADAILIDNSGKILLEKHNINTTEIQFPMQQFARGTYFIKIDSGNKTITLKLIKE